MKSRKSILYAIVFLLVLSVAALAGSAVSAETVPPADDFDYEAVYNAQGGFAGVNIKESLGGAFRAGSKAAITSNHFGVVTVEFDAADTAESTGLLVKILGTNRNFPNFYVEDSEGAKYRASVATNYTFIQEDGTQSVIVSKSTANTIEVDATGIEGIAGTVYFPWSAFALGGDKQITKFHYSTPMFSTFFNAELTIGSLATVSVDEGSVTVQKLVNTAELDFSVDADDEDADVNIASPSKGKVVYSNIMYVSRATLHDVGSDFANATVANWKYLRQPYEVTFNLVDEDGEQIAAPQKAFGAYDATTYAFSYDVTAPAVTGYAYVSADTAMSGAMTGNIDITLTYAQTNYLLTVNFEDADGNELKASVVEVLPYDENGEAEYDITGIAAEVIDGYKYVSADAALSGTLTGNLAITLTYKKSTYALTVRFEDEEGTEIQSAVTEDYAYDENEEYEYTITPPDISGYTFQSATPGLSGVITEDAEITLTYGLTRYVLTLRFEDEDGRTVKEPQEQIYTYGESGKAPYAVAAPRLAGYTYLNVDSELEGELEGDKEIVFTYSLNQDLDYDIIYDEDEKFAGVNIKDSLAMALRVGVVTAENFSTTTNGFGIVTVAFPYAIDTAETDGLLFKFQAPNRALGYRLFFEDSLGRVYRTITEGARNDVFVKEDGTVDELAMTAWYHRPAANAVGTLHLNWEDLVGAAGEGWVHTPLVRGVKIAKFHIAVEMRNAGWAGAGYTVGSFASFAVGEDQEVTVTKLYDTREFVYSNDSEDELADVNFADVTKGNLIYSRHSIQGGYPMNSDDSQDTLNTISNFEYGLRAPELLILHVDEDGKELAIPTTVVSEYNEEGKAVYTITPSTITGYVFKEADAALTGVAVSDMIVTITYEPAEYVITLVFVDEEGNELADSETVTYLYREIYSVEAKEIRGYIFDFSSRALTGTTVNNMTITLNYVKKGGGCNASSALTSTLSAALVLAIAATYVFVKKQAVK